MIKRFYRHSKAFYAYTLKADTKEISISIDDINGEVFIVWHQLAGEFPYFIRSYDDSLNVLLYCQDLIQYLSDNKCENITEEEMSEILLKLGYVDSTKYKQE